MDKKILIEAERVRLEILRREGKTDPLAFSKALGFNADAWQAQFLCSRERRRILNCSRQSGKSTVAALLAFWVAYYNPRATILLISPTLKQSTELLRKVMDFVEASPMACSLDADNLTMVELANRSRVICLPANEGNIRTFTATLIIEDEAGDVPDDVHFACLPMIAASGGSLVLMGTPKGRRGHFFEAWERGGEDWERYEVHASACSRLNLDELAIQKRAMGVLYSREYECQFIEAAAGLVYGSFDEKRNTIPVVPVPLTSPEWRFMLGIDFGFHDDCAFVVTGYLPEDSHVYFIASHKQSGMIPSEAAKYVKELPYKFSRYIGDVGGLGKGYAEEMRRRWGLPIEAAEKVNKAGYIDLMNGDLATGRILIVKPTNTQLIDEMTSLPWNDKRSGEAEGFANHLTDAALYVWRESTSYLTQPKAQTWKGSPEGKAAHDEGMRKALARYEAHKKHHDEPRGDIDEGVPDWMRN